MCIYMCINSHTCICIYICMCGVSTAIELFLQTVQTAKGNDNSLNFRRSLEVSHDCHLSFVRYSMTLLRSIVRSNDKISFKYIYTHIYICSCVQKHVYYKIILFLWLLQTSLVLFIPLYGFPSLPLI